MGSLTNWLRSTLRDAGREYAAARATSAESTPAEGLSTDDEGRIKLVCRRHAERRAVEVDDEGRPACYDGDHPDCRGCHEDVQAGTIETW